MDKAMNFKKCVACVLMALGWLLPLKAQNTISLGFCNGEMASTTSYQLTGKGYVSAALRLPAAALRAYAGNELTAIRVIAFFDRMI